VSLTPQISHDPLKQKKDKNGWNFTCPVFTLFLSYLSPISLIPLIQTIRSFEITIRQDFQFGISNGLFKIGLRFFQLQIALHKNQSCHKYEHHLSKYDKENSD